MGRALGEYIEPHPEFSFDRLEVRYGPPGREHVFMYTEDCRVIRLERLVGASGVAYWEVHVIDKVGLVNEVIRFTEDPGSVGPSVLLAFAEFPKPPKPPIGSQERIPTPPTPGNAPKPLDKGWEGLGQEKPINPWGKDLLPKRLKGKSWKDLGKTDAEDPWGNTGPGWLPDDVVQFVPGSGDSGGPGISDWFSDLSRGQTTPSGNSGGGTLVSYTPNASTPPTSSSTSTSDNPATTGATRPGGGHWEDRIVRQYAHPTGTGTVTTPVWVPDERPNPASEGAVGLSRDPFIAAQQAKALGFAGRTIRTPNGPVLAFAPEGGASATGDTTGTQINWEMLDPVAPYAGGIYEPSSRPRGGGPSRRTRMANQAIKAFYPEGSGPGADEDDETLAAIAAINTGRPMPAPEAPGDPAAMRFGGNVVAVSTGAAPAAGSPSAAMVVAYSAGAGSPTIEFDGAGRARRVGR